MLLECKCKHKFQQKEYGDKRVHTPKTKEGKLIGYACTVCENQKPL